MLSRAEKEFLDRLGYGIGDVFDARGKSTAQWKREVREVGKRLVLGSPCKVAGHRLRTRSGHCVQCDPSKLAFQNRYHSEGVVYIAGSQSAKVIKFGVANDALQRERNLNGHQYGGISDWKLLFFLSHAEAGKLERRLFNALSRHQIIFEFMKDGITTDASEILSCNFSDAIAVVEKELGSSLVRQGWFDPNIEAYNFKRK